MKDNKLIIYGIHAIESTLNKSPERIIRLCVLQDRQDKKLQAIMSLAKDSGIRIEVLSRNQLDGMTDHGNHQGVVAWCQQAKNYSENDLERILKELTEPAFLLILDGVQDPHNLGAILRTADAAGVHAVIAPKDKAVGITATVSKVACGAAEVVPFIQVTNLARTLQDLKDKNIWIYGAAGEAEQDVFQAKLKGAIAIVMGAEGEGLRRLTKDNCDFLLKIPMKGSVSSLNVSVATGVFLFEAVRQRVVTSPN